jgi:hypothetical protein
VLTLFREFSPLLRQVLVLVSDGRIAIGEPLAFVGASAEFLESVTILGETQLTSRQCKIEIHGLILCIRGLPPPPAPWCQDLGNSLCEPPHTDLK